jgi:pimeloyl-ACP methyl ester carboxylesterase
MVDALYEEYGGPDGEEIDFAALFAPETFRHRFGNDMDDDRYEWCASVRVPESTALSGDPVDLSGLDLPTPRVWVVATRDEMNRPDRQRRYAERVRPDRVLELDAGHMCMVSDPVGLAALLDELAAAV